MKSTLGQTLQQHKRLIAVVLFLVLLFALFDLSGARAHFSLGFLQQVIREHQTSGLLIFVLAFALGNLIQIPGWVFLAAAVLTLGELSGGMATFIAASISCIVTFFTIRLVGGNALRQLDSTLAANLLSRLDAHPISSIMLLRILFQTLPALNYTLAMSGVRFRPYLIGTLLGLPLPIAVYCVFFDSLAKALKIV
ncbi:MAG: VTT domain-containing protein [Sulfuriferula multivorans]|uniref:TVP38/TMEM64 family membrane protein n=1 Tax=Sulfuriferula multivorans TaxID=1559896 RepID=A0A7C9TA24_9PROT|nr:VTT domain-containing protein [Sulfuriferula multivorans]